MFDCGRRNHKFFEKAKSVAALSEFARAKIGCVAVYNNKIISIGINSHKTHPIQKKYNKFRDIRSSNGCCAFLHSLHAELDCLLSVDEESINMGKVEVYLYRITKTGKMATSKPCPGCRQFLKDKGIKKIHYTTYDSFVTEELID